MKRRGPLNPEKAVAALGVALAHRIATMDYRRLCALHRVAKTRLLPWFKDPHAMLYLRVAMEAAARREANSDAA